MRLIGTLRRASTLPVVALASLALVATGCDTDTDVDTDEPATGETEDLQEEDDAVDATPSPTEEDPVDATPSPTEEDAAAGDGGEADLAVARDVAAEFADPQAALDAGYMPAEACVANPQGEGAMGYHYVNPDLIDATVTPEEPEVLVYVPAQEGEDELTLGAVEYFVPDADQDLSTDDDRPTAFGEEFDGPMEGHEPGQPAHYDLHVWTGVDNPAGMFAAFNPDVTCPESDRVEG